MLSVDISQGNGRAMLHATQLNIYDLEHSISNPYSEANNESFDLGPMHAFIGVNPVTMSSVLQVDLSNDTGLDRVMFKDSIDKAYKLVFALSVGGALRSESTLAISKERNSSYTTAATQNGIYVSLAISSGFAVASEVLLGLAVIVAVFDLVSYWRRLSLLRHDPDSLAALLAFISFHFRKEDIVQTLDSRRAEITATSQLKQMIASLVCQLSKIANGLTFEVRKA